MLNGQGRWKCRHHHPLLVAYCACDNTVQGMIRTFKDAATQELFVGRKHRHFSNVATVALRKLDQIQSALALNDLQEPPGNRLEALKGDRAGQHSIRINDQFRICFIWKSDGAYAVEITDYH